MSKPQEELWKLVYSTLRPKAKDGSPNGCLNRLVRERSLQKPVNLNEKTADVYEELWSTPLLGSLERWHKRQHDFDDDRPLVIVELEGRKLVIDGNHRLTRWLANDAVAHRPLLVIRPKTNVVQDKR
jgi:hypothetical protein